MTIVEDNHIVGTFERLNLIREYNNGLFTRVGRETLQSCLTLLKCSYEQTSNVDKMFPREVVAAAISFQESNYNALMYLIDTDDNYELELCDDCYDREVDFESNGLEFNLEDYCEECEKRFFGISGHCSSSAFDFVHDYVEHISYNIDDCETFYMAFEQGFQEWDRSFAYEPIYEILRKYDGGFKDKKSYECDEVNDCIETRQYKMKNELMKEIENRNVLICQ